LKTLALSLPRGSTNNCAKFNPDFPLDNTQCDSGTNGKNKNNNIWIISATFTEPSD